jgi:hypothetical protein
MLISKRVAHMPQDVPKQYKVFRHFEHICVIMNTNGAPLVYGYNTYSNNDSFSTEHAEAMAFRKLNCLRKQMKIRGKLAVNILVVRTNGGNSKPCNTCIDCMYRNSANYTIRKVYYSDNTDPEGFQKESFSSLLNDPNKHESAYFRFQQQQKEDEEKEKEKEQSTNQKKKSKKDGKDGRPSSPTPKTDTYKKYTAR